MAKIDCKGITVDLPIYGEHNMNLKARVANFIVRQKNDVESIRALEGLSLSIQNGERIGIVGPNGSGKTTLLRVLAGALIPTHGTIDIQGSVVSMIDQGLGLDAQCTGMENIFRRGMFLNQNKNQMRILVEDIVELSGLGERIRHPLYTYSSGMKARLAFSIATSIKPEILIVDEGIGAADEEFAERASIRLNAFFRDAGILVLASHSNQLIDAWCTRKIRIEKGHFQSSQAI